MYTLDEALPQTMGQAFNVTLGVLAVIAVIASVTPAFLLVVVPLGIPFLSSDIPFP
jgi:hypothetical protein